MSKLEGKVSVVTGEDPHENQGRRVLFFSGDDASAKQELGQLFGDMGFAPVDLGDLATGGRMQQLGAPLSGLNLLKLPTTLDKVIFWDK